MNNKIIKIIVTLGLAFTILLLINPYHVWGSNTSTSIILGTLFILFVIFSIFVFMEMKGDERESAHRMQAGRAAGFAGATVLILAIIVEGLHGTPDRWLIAALAVMIFVKIGIRIYSEYKW